MRQFTFSLGGDNGRAVQINFDGQRYEIFHKGIMGLRGGWNYSGYARSIAEAMDHVDRLFERFGR